MRRNVTADADMSPSAVSRTEAGSSAATPKDITAPTMAEIICEEAVRGSSPVSMSTLRRVLVCGLPVE